MLHKHGREVGFEKKILRNIEDLQNFSKPAEIILIHLGDFCIGNDEKWHEEWRKHTIHFKKKILIKGNHDNKSYSWYYDHGWDAVVESLRMKAFGKNLLLSHFPVLKKDSNYTIHPEIDLNIHGHLHGRANLSHRAVDGYDTNFNYDCAPDTHDYLPVKLQDIIPVDN